MDDTNSKKDCSTCRHAATTKWPKAIEATGFGDQIMFDDVDEVAYSCRAESGPHAGKEIGATPVSCESFVPAAAPTARAKSPRLEELDRLIAARERGER